MLEQNINTLEQAWTEAGQQVNDLDEELYTQVLNPEMDDKEYKALKEKRDKAKIRRDAIKNQLDEIGASKRVPSAPKQMINYGESINQSNKKMNSDFVQAFKAMIKGDANYKNLISSSDDPASSAAAGLTIPNDVQTQINEFIRSSNSLQNYISIESVGTSKGMRVYEQFETMTPLNDIDNEDTNIPDNDEPKLFNINYDIHRFAGVNTVTNSLLADSEQNILAWLTDWLKKKVVVTRNQKIISVLNTMPNKPTISKFDDIIDLYTKGIDPALDSGSMFLTNQLGWNVISKIKNQFGGYLINPNVQESGNQFLNGKPVIVLPERDLPDSNNAHPLYFGNFKEAVRLYDRQSMSLLSSNIADDAFRKDQTKIRMIDRFDVQAVDKEAVIAASFKNIADLNTATSSTK